MEFFFCDRYVPTRRKRQQSRTSFGPVDEFDQDVFSGNSSGSGNENVNYRSGQADTEFTTDYNNGTALINENAINIQALEANLTDRFTRNLDIVVDTIEGRIQNAILAACKNIITPRIELAVRSITASSGRHASSVEAGSNREKQAGIITPSAHVSSRNNTFQELNSHDEIRVYTLDEVGEFWGRNFTRNHQLMTETLDFFTQLKC